MRPIVMFLGAAALAGAAAGEALPGGLASVLEAMQQRELAGRYRAADERARIDAAGVSLGTWHRIGPFRDRPPLLNWMENVASSFACPFPAEKDALAAGGAARLEKAYPAGQLPATPRAVRRWTPQPGWIDGYLCDLPRGPAPSAGETQYVYRTLTARRAVSVRLEFAVRSPESDRRQNEPNMEHWRRQARYACWLNGREVARWEGRGPVPTGIVLTLERGTNHFLAKITNNRHAYGFSFAIVGLHPLPRRPGAHEQPWRPFRSYRPNDLPYFRQADGLPRIVSRPTWWESLFATAEALAGPARTSPGRRREPIVLADFDGEDYAGWKATGSAFGPGPARGAIGRQMKVSGYLGRGLVNTFRGGDGAIGTLTSPPFVLNRRYVNFLIGGGGFAGRTCIDLLVDGKVVRTAAGPNVTPGGSEKLSWRSWDVADLAGRRAVVRIVDNHTGGWGHINVDQITLADTPAGPLPAAATDIWDALQQHFPDARSRFEIELCRGADAAFWKAWLPAGDRPAAERALADHLLARTAEAAGVPKGRIVETLGIGREAADFAPRAARACFAALRYREGLIRLREFRGVHTPMPGIEVAARDSRGRVVPVMEAMLEGYPESPEGREHRLDVEAIGREVVSLLNRLTADRRADYGAVCALDDRIEAMWSRRIEALPPIIFLQRPPYRYDALQFTKNGSAPAFVRVFDPAGRSLRTIFHRPEVRAHDMTLSWDARTVLIGGGGKVARVGTDGEGYRVITTGQSPTELPDGRIIFFDDTPGISPCKATGPRRLLFTIRPDGTDRKVVSANLTIDTTPQVLEDGRVVFCRWDYGVNKNVFNRHGIWVQNPDGTEMDLFFGNTVIDPFAFYRPRPVPGRPEVAVIFGTHHNNNAGLVGLIWQGAGREAPDGAGYERITHDTASVGDACPHWAWQDPFPLNEQLFLASYGGERDRNVSLWLLDRFGNRKCIFEPAGAFGAYCPQPFRPRKRPPRIADRTTNTEWQPGDLHEQLLTDPDFSRSATLLLQDVYRGIEPEVPRGRVKYLAVMEQVPETDPRGGAIGVGTIFYVNRLIGLVPVEPDGSAHFEVPALRSLYFHVLDADGRMLMTMGSDMHAMPGENRGCVGCHEQRKGLGTSPDAAAPPLAARKPPVRPRLPGWGTRGILEYEAVVQPVLDRYCIRCHSGPRPKANLDLSASRTTVYNMSYMQLVDRGLVHFVPGTGRTHAQPSNDYDEQAPLSRGSLLSRILPHLEDPNHCGRRIPWEDRFRVLCWIDTNVPFYSHYTQMSPTILSDAARGELLAAYRRRCAACHDRRPRKDAVTHLSKYNTWVHAGRRPGQWGITESGMRVRHLNLTRPAESLALQAPLAKAAGGLGLCAGPDGRAVFADRTDPDYRRILQALTNGVVRRNQPGVFEILRRRKLARGR